jgi:PAS domain-containing protein
VPILRWLRSHHESITGADTLALALVELHPDLLPITAVRGPANTVREEQLAMLLETTLDETLRVGRVNPAATRLFGCTAEDLVGENLRDFSRPGETCSADYAFEKSRIPAPDRLRKSS